MFKMIGGDGREYGPVSAEQLREWIADHRANGQTRVLAEGDSAWRPLADLPEFAEALAAAVPPPSEPPLPAAEVRAAPVAPGATLAEARGELQVLDCVGRGWLLLQQHFLLIAGASFLAWGAQTLPMFLGRVGAVFSLVISGAVFGGLCVLVLNLARGLPAGMADISSCFGSRFLACSMVYVITGLLGQLGFALCLLPGIFLSVVWVFSLPLAADRGLDFTTALRASWRAVLPRFFSVLGVLALAFLPMVVFSIYSTAMMTSHLMGLMGSSGSFNPTLIWDNLKPLSEYAARLGFEQQMVLLLNLPFAYATLLTAYEDIFGSGRPPSA